MQRICVTLSDEEHRAVVPSVIGVTLEQGQADARRKGKRKGQGDGHASKRAD